MIQFNQSTEKKFFCNKKKKKRKKRIFFFLIIIFEVFNHEQICNCFCNSLSCNSRKYTSKIIYLCLLNLSIYRYRQEVIINDQSDESFLILQNLSKLFYIKLFFSFPFSFVNFFFYYVLATLIHSSSIIIVSYDQVLSNRQNNSLMQFNYF